MRCFVWIFKNHGGSPRTLKTTPTRWFFTPLRYLSPALNPNLYLDRYLIRYLNRYLNLYLNLYLNRKIMEVLKNF